MRPEKSEVERLLADSSLARKVLGWEPAVTLEQGLIKTIEWFKQNKGRYSSDDYRV
jgi:nucleoside-diphosphate-sugar epimerase